MSKSLSPQKTANATLNSLSGICPKCGNANNCALVQKANSESPAEFNCWCRDPKFKFTCSSKASVTKADARCLCATCGV